MAIQNSILLFDRPLGEVRGEYLPYTQEVEVHYREAIILFASIGFSHGEVNAWCDLIDQQKGTSHGLSGQSTQAVSSNTSQSQSGGGSLIDAKCSSCGYQQQIYLAPGNGFVSRCPTCGSQFGAFSPGSVAQQGLGNQLNQYQPGLQNALSGGAGGLGPAAYNQAVRAQMAAKYPMSAGAYLVNPATGAPLKIEGIRIGEIIAWRGWKVTPQGFLRSLTAEVVWAPGEPMEGKTKSKEEHCGVYAFKRASDFLKEFGDGDYVYGQVALWGDCILHELGYRAENAKILSIAGATTKVFRSQLKQLRETYGVPAAI